MLSKFLRPASILRQSYALVKKKPIIIQPIRSSSEYVPPTQYDVPIPQRLNILYVLRVYWETIPLFLVTLTSLSLCACAIIWATLNKMDVVYTTHSKNNLSRTMDLRNPSVHKIIIINQRYAPWPEMQDVLDKMSLAQRTAIMKAQLCPKS